MKLKHLIDEYQKIYPFYQELTVQVQALLTSLLNHQSIHIHSVTGRTKSKASLENKLIKANHKYHALSDITDLCGIRIITYYEDEIDQINDFLRKNFSIDEENSIDKRKLLAPDSFGYLSLHLIVNLSPDSHFFPNAHSLPDCKVEIQIRSILQHAWAEIQHDLAYKHQERETKETRRQFSRLAGMLEIADLEFAKIRDHLTAKSNALPSTEAELAKIPSPPKAIARFYDAPSFFLRWTADCITLSILISLLTNLYFGSGITHLASQLSNLLITC